MQINIQDLLEKFRKGTINADELVMLENWYLQWQPESAAVSAEELEAIKEGVWQAIQPQAKPFVSKVLWPRIAAAASVLLILSVSIYYFTNTNQPKQKAVVVKQVIPDVKPGGNRAMLTLANGQQIVLTDVKNGKLAEQGDITIDKTADGRVVYAPLSAQMNAPGKLLYNTMTTPRGGQYNLTLSDGTRVWLNAASSITYPVTFIGNERRVVVNGEAYFEVAHNADKPFKVESFNQEITVLGTHFNVKSYDDDGGISTTLLSGSINLKNIHSGEAKLLAPGQQAKIGRNTNTFTIKTVNPEDAISWKNGYFLFDNQEIKSIMKIMSRWYDIDIQYKNTMNEHDRFGGTFSRSSNLSETLQNLERVGKVHFIIQTKKVIVTD
ncbi:FecR family protein [Mucilaginibacter sp. UYCu711]|uniref:FecR family protein n=1 Tax=Mucilaginibacter sp. UYCu711 TaxID=3156339 RepID=UPI003D197E7A